MMKKIFALVLLLVLGKMSYPERKLQQQREVLIFGLETLTQQRGYP